MRHRLSIGRNLLGARNRLGRCSTHSGQGSWCNISHLGVEHDGAGSAPEGRPDVGDSLCVVLRDPGGICEGEIRNQEINTSPLAPGAAAGEAKVCGGSLQFTWEEMPGLICFLESL